MDIIVTDHHRPPDLLPEAYAVLNPKRGEKNEELGDLAGVGVAFYLAAALRTHFRTKERWANSEQPNLRKYLDLVALGTLADMAPLTGTNRILARVGLIELSRTDRCGLRELKKTCGLDSSTVTDWDVLFKLGPRLNAAGRLGSGDPSLRLLLSTNPAEARPLAQELERLNRKRQLVEDQLLAEALYMVETDDSFKQRSSLVLASPGWHKGLLGLVASRLVERFNKPTILLTQTDQYWEGSGRSVSTFDLYRAVYRCRDQLKRFGGHRLAVGLGLEQDQLAGFCAAFENLAKEEISQVDSLPHKRVDAMVRLEEITPRLMEYLQCMQPHGVGNPEPIFCCGDFQVEKSHILKDRHLQLTVRQGKTRLGCIGFNLMKSEQTPPAPKWLVFSPRWNTWRGKRRIQLHILDYC
jgi:single-stranded-DNA-specific exonuclease